MRSESRRKAALNEYLKSFEISRAVHICIIKISNCSFCFSTVEEFTGDQFLGKLGAELNTAHFAEYTPRLDFDNLVEKKILEPLGDDYILVSHSHPR
jgi:hypothetical protein